MCAALAAANHLATVQISLDDDSHEIGLFRYEFVDMGRDRRLKKELAVIRDRF